ENGGRTTDGREDVVVVVEMVDGVRRLAVTASGHVLRREAPTGRRRGLLRELDLERVWDGEVRERDTRAGRRDAGAVAAHLQEVLASRRLRDRDALDGDVVRRRATNVRESGLGVVGGAQRDVRRAARIHDFGDVVRDPRVQDRVVVREELRAYSGEVDEVIVVPGAGGGDLERRVAER